MAGVNTMREQTTMPPKPHPDGRDFIANRWSRFVLQPLLIAAMSTSLCMALFIVIQIVVPSNPWYTLVPFSFLATLEGIYTTLWLVDPKRRQLNRFLYRSAEFIFILLILRFYVWLLFRDIPPFSSLIDIIASPFSLLISPIFLVAAVLLYVTWQAAVTTTLTFHALAVDRAEAHYYSLAPHERQGGNQPVILDRWALVGIFFQQWVWGGIVLTMCAALSTLDLPTLRTASSLWGVGRLGLRPEMLISLIVYFVTGFLLLSQGRLAALNARWLIQGARKGEQVERSWQRNSGWLLLTIALVAALLPIGSTFALGRLIEIFLWFIYNVVAFIIAIIWLIFIAIFSLFAAEERAEPLPRLDFSDFGPPPTAEPLLPTISPVASGIFYWFLIAALVAAAAVYFLRERGITLGDGAVGQGWQRVRGWWQRFWQSLWRTVSGGTAAITGAVRARFSGSPSADNPPTPWRFMRLNALPPREQIRYFYLSTVRRAAEKGVARGRSETPSEFAADLTESWPEAEPDFESLTEAFIKARYSPKPIPKEELSPVKARWKRIKASLRHKRRAGE